MKEKDQTVPLTQSENKTVSEDIIEPDNQIEEAVVIDDGNLRSQQGYRPQPKHHHHRGHSNSPIPSPTHRQRELVNKQVPREPTKADTAKEIGRILAIVILFVVLLGLFAGLIIRVIMLPDDALFVSSLEAVGGFFRDTSLAALLVTLVKDNVPKEAVQGLRDVINNRRPSYHQPPMFEDTTLDHNDEDWYAD